MSPGGVGKGGVVFREGVRASYIQLRIDNRGKKSRREVGEAMEVAPLWPAAPGITNL